MKALICNNIPKLQSFEKSMAVLIHSIPSSVKNISGGYPSTLETVYFENPAGWTKRMGSILETNDWESVPSSDFEDPATAAYLFKTVTRDHNNYKWFYTFKHS